MCRQRENARVPRETLYCKPLQQAHIFHSALPRMREVQSVELVEVAAEVCPRRKERSCNTSAAVECCA